MTDSKYHTPEASSLEGRVFRPATANELAEAVELAFDYRGDVTLQLQSGETIEGYLFNRDSTGVRPSVQIYPKGSQGIRQVLYAEVATIAFTGRTPPLDSPGRPGWRKNPRSVEPRLRRPPQRRRRAGICRAVCSSPPLPQIPFDSLSWLTDPARRPARSPLERGPARPPKPL